MSVRISNCIPVFNGEKYLEEAIKSSLKQDEEDFELIIGNDGSTDRSLEIMQDYALTDKRITIVSRTQNRGMGHSINELFRIATGKYLINTSCDDKNHQDRYSKICNFLDTNSNISICGHGLNMFGKKNYISQNPTDHNTIKFICFALGSMGLGSICMRREVFDNFTYSTKYGSMLDYAFMVNIICHSNYRFANIPEVLYDFRLHDSNADQMQPRLLRFQRKVDLALKCFTFVYKINIDLIVKKVATDLPNSSMEDIKKAREELIRVANILNKKYKKSFKIDIGQIFLKPFLYLFNDKNFIHLKGVLS